MTPLNARIPTDLHKHLRIEAINRGERVQDLVAEALRRFLGHGGAKAEANAGGKSKGKP